MVQQTADSKFNQYGLGSPETNLLSRDKQQLVAMKKTALRELQNENRILVPKPNGNSPYSKDGGPTIDAIKVSGSKRPLHEFPVSPSKDSNVANGHLVYVRRKFEADVGKASTSDSTNISAVDSTHLSSVRHPESIHQKAQIKEPKVSSFPAFAPLPTTSFVSPPGKPSVPLFGKSGIKSTPAESNCHPVTSAAPSLGNSRGMEILHWEGRFHRLQTLLKKLDQSDQEDYVQMLRSLSSVELSRHAVELEKRSIQLSLEEAKEVSRVAMLNVLGKSIRNLKEHLIHQDQSNK